MNPRASLTLHVTALTDGAYWTLQGFEVNHALSIFDGDNLPEKPGGAIDCFLLILNAVVRGRIGSGIDPLPPPADPYIWKCLWAVAGTDYRLLVYSTCELDPDVQVCMPFTTIEFLIGSER